MLSTSLCASSAYADYTAGTPLTVGPFLASSIGVNQTNGDVFVASQGGMGALPVLETGKFQRFTSAGSVAACSLTPALTHTSGVTVSPANENVHLINTTGNASQGRLYAFPKACGTQIGTEVLARGGTGDLLPQIAADPAGNTYFPNSNEDILQKFAWDGVENKFTASTLLSGLSQPAAVALDGAGDIYLASGVVNCETTAAGKLQRYEADGTPLGAFAGLDGSVGNGEVTTVAVDRGSGDVFVGRGCGSTFRIEKYSPSGVKLTEFGAGQFVEDFPAYKNRFNHLAVEESSGRVYAIGWSSSASRVEVFTPGPEFPLTVDIVESGGTGTVECEIAGSGVLEPCAPEYEEGIDLTVVAIPTPGSNFGGWSGDCDTIADDECAVEIDGAKTITAEFVEGGNELEIVKGGTGLVTVTGGSPSEPDAIDCGLTCSAFFDEGDVVTLEVDPEFSDFDGWTTLAGNPGTCTGTTSPCEVTMSADVELEASSTRRIHTLTVEPGADGSVTAVEPPAPQSGSITACEESAGSCVADYNEGETVVLAATPVAGHEASWTGCTPVGGEPNECEVTIPNGDVAVQVAFPLEEHLLTVAVGGSGQGTVSGGSPSDPNTIDCGAGGTECEHEYTHGDTVTLVQAPLDSESEFEGWTGCDRVLGPEEEECEVDMLGAKSVTATFVQVGQFTLAVVKEGNSTGTVVSEPAGTINCGTGAGCESEFEAGEEIVLVGQPGANATVSWSGCDEVIVGNKCKVAMTANKTVHAIFNLVQRTLTVAPTNVAPGEGEVDASSGAISGCKVGGGVCAGPYDHNATVTLTAVPAGDASAFWTGSGCQSNPTPNQCVVQMSAAKTVGVTFAVTHSFAVDTVGGTGTGVVRCNGGACASQYPDGTVLQVNAIPDPHNSFEGWSVTGDPGTTCTGTTTPCTITVGGDVEVDAPFERIVHTLTVVPSGAGTVDAGSGPILGCEEGGGTCSGLYAEGSTVLLTATPPVGAVVEWSGCDSSTSTACAIEIPGGDAQVEVAFKVMHALSVGTVGSGSVSCDGGPCASSYPEGTTVTLAATPSSGSSFVGWLGGGCAGTGECAVTIGGDVLVTAVFSVPPPPVLLPPRPQTCTVPNLVGRSPKKAREAIAAAGCRVGDVTRPQGKGRRGRLVVRGSTPSAGATLLAGGEVDMRLGFKAQKRKTQRRKNRGHRRNGQHGKGESS